MAYQTVDPQPYYTNGSNNKDYILQYDTTDGSVRLVEAGVTAVSADNILFVGDATNGGNFTQTANTLNLPASTRQSLFNDIVVSVQQSYNTAKNGGASNPVLPGFANPQANGSPGNQSQPPYASPANTVSNAFNTILGVAIDPADAIAQAGLQNAARWGTDRAASLFGGTPMKYPLDIQVGRQDCLVIEAFRYVPVNQNLLTPGGTNLSNLALGLQRGNDRVQEPVGTVFFPMPAGITDTKGASWGQGNLNTFNAAVANKAANDPKAILTPALLGAIAQALNLPGAAGAKYATQIALMIEAAQGNATSADAQALIGAGLVDKLTNIAGFGVDAETILARGAGIVSNQNTELLFQGPSLRTFSCAYKMTARSANEAREIRKIIRFFKQVSSPKKVSGGAGSPSLFLGTPDVFTLKFCTRDMAEIPGVSRFKTCALTQITTDYTPDRQWLAYDDGQPVSTTIMLQFAELEPIYENDYQDYINPNRNRNLRPVPNDSVGY